MEIVLAAVVAAVVSGAVVLLVQRTAPRARVAAPGGHAGPSAAPGATGTARRAKERAEPAAPVAAETVSDIEHELRERRGRDRPRRGAHPRRRSSRSTSAWPSSSGASARSRTAARNLEHQGEELKQARQRQLSELERIAGLSISQAKQILLQGARGRAAPRERGADPPRRGGGAPGRRPARAQHPLDRHAAGRGRPRGRDDRLGRPARVGRDEGPDHRPRGPQHPRARDAHRNRLHHRRHAVGGAPVRASTACGARSPG